ncbi:MAG: GntR family transcriptional regulator [Paracoccus sp. (in: a-proteobacteria)]|uniref:GntR family transcriptional regulator n=1 Tax=Paracoccus sp. TaxID=267 RepID=UPI0040586E80
MTKRSTQPPATGPLHAQVRELIREQAISGEIVDRNGRLLTEAALVERYGVSRVTIRNAIGPLVESGMFDRTPRRGTFLRSGYAEQWVGHLLGFQEAVAEAGFRPGAAVLESGMTNLLDDELREVLQERAVWQLRRIRFADDTPVAIEHAFYPPDIGLEIAGRDLITIKMYEVFEQELGHEIGGAVQTIGARISSPEDEAALELAQTSALVEMTRVTRAACGRPLELLRSAYRPDFFQFSITLRRRSY